VRYWYRVRQWLGRGGRTEVPAVVPAGNAMRRGRKRLLVLLFLFDALLIVATLLSFQNAELIEQEQVVEETRDVYEVVYREEIVTLTTVITEVVPYGSIP
jgi:hypothetical protein